MSYLDDSPYYRALRARHGDTMPVESADDQADQHGTRLADLVREEDLVIVAERVNTLDFVKALGY